MRTLTRGLLLVASFVPALLHSVTAASDDPDERSMRLYLDETRTNITASVFIAAFGDPLERKSKFKLQLPPKDDDGHLCKMPGSFVSATRNDVGLGQSADMVGLFVSEGACSAEEKAGVVLAMQRIVPSIKYLLIYGIDQLAATTPVTLVADSDPVPFKFYDVAIIYVPYDYANAIMAYDVELLPAPSQYLSGTVSPFRTLHFRIDGKPHIDRPPSNSLTTANFQWLRFVLFALLIVAPCFRAVYLWFVGGGRLHWRRNEQGRVVGLQHVPPVPYWLAVGRFHPQPRTPVQNTLSEEQFATLPEIKFQHPSPAAVDEAPLEAEGEFSGEENIVAMMQPKVGVESLPKDVNRKKRVQTMLEKDLELQMSATDISLEKILSVDDDDGDSIGQVSLASHEDPSTSTLARILSADDPTLTAPETKCAAASPSPLGVVVAMESAPPEAAPTHDATATTCTTCTTCSICIDDFDQGETLTLLPRCKHAFHRGCIRPWLLERQGCCPLCKTSVLSDGQDTDGVSSDDGAQLREDDATVNDGDSPEEPEQLQR